jgi:FlaA1/EpsC-like NDP-sugar epimerase
LTQDDAEELRRNNVLGFAGALAAAQEYGVRRFALLSLDEADLEGQLACVHRACELLVRERGASGTSACALRFPSVVGSPRSQVTRIAEALQRGAAVTAPSLDARVHVATLRGVVPLLLEALTIAQDRDVLAIEARETRSLDDVVRYLRRVWNLPEPPFDASPMLPDHLHPLEVGEATSHPRIVRRLANDPAPCAVALLRDLVPDAGTGELPSVVGSSR